jgi:drug/metabolite transporter (DMT)-like permease
MAAAPRTGRQHASAVLQGLLVTFLWSTSWVLIKIGLDDLSLRPLSFAGLRYGLAALVLLPFAVQAVRGARAARSADARLVGLVALYGVLFVAVAQGAQYAALAVLPATAVNLILSSIPVAVAALAIASGRERPTAAQGAGIGVLLLGALLYFGPADLGSQAPLGVGAAVICLGAAAVSAHMGRGLAGSGMARVGGPIGLTALSMVVGGAVLLVVGVALEGFPSLTLSGWLIVVWLAVVNTAIAFTIWNHTLRTLTAVESSVVNNTMTVQIAVLAMVFLGEAVTPIQVLGLLLAAFGAAAVQIAPVLRRG